MTWSEFIVWLEGYRERDYRVTAHLLRQVAYQMITLHPYIDKSKKPYDIYDYMTFPTDEIKRKEVEYIDPQELAKKWLKS